MIESVELRNARVTVGSREILKGLSLRIQAGDLVGILGPNGSGKSTLLSVLAGHKPLRSGELLLNQASLISNLSLVQSLRQQTMWLRHELMLYPTFTVLENLRFALNLWGQNQSERLDRWVEHWSMRTMLDRPISKLSRGQQQRVALIRTFATQASLLLLDEPTTGLDAESVKKLKEALIEKKSEGGLTVLVSHDTDFLTDLPSHKLNLKEGRFSS